MMAAILIILVVIITFAATFGARHEGDAAPHGRMAWVRAIAYWLLTILVAFEMAAGALWDLLRIEHVRVVFAHLGYPLYLLLILGAWKLPCALALLAPRFPRLKEWAYAGAFFDYTGAAASHLLAGDQAGQWVGPLVFAGFTVGSWWLRPASRRLAPLGPANRLRVVTWSVPILIAVAMLLFAFFTLPKGAPPQ